MFNGKQCKQSFFSKAKSQLSVLRTNGPLVFLPFNPHFISSLFQMPLLRNKRLLLTHRHPYPQTLHPIPRPAGTVLRHSHKVHPDMVRTCMNVSGYYYYYYYYMERGGVVVERQYSKSRGPGFDPHRRHCVVSLSKTH